jgi:hypothetical protein
LFPVWLLVVTAVVALIEVVVATLAGAWVYSEKEAKATTVRSAAA